MAWHRIGAIEEAMMGVLRRRRVALLTIIVIVCVTKSKV